MQAPKKCRFCVIHSLKAARYPDRAIPPLSGEEVIEMKREVILTQKYQDEAIKQGIYVTNTPDILTAAT